MSRTVKWAAAGLTALTAVRLLIAGLAPLAPDEAYYWVWSRALAAGYVDHPPMVALWIRAGTAIAGPSALGVRLLGPLSAALGSCLLYDAAERLFPGRGAGVTASGLLNGTLLLGIGAVIMTPDTPLLLFWTATLWAAARLIQDGRPSWWLAAGAFAGLALLSKYTAAFLPIGLALFVVIASPRSLRSWQLWAGAGIGLLLFLPVILWNADHDWAGILRQGGRVADWNPSRAISFLGELVGGQIGLATPGIFILLVAGCVTAIRVAARSRDPAWTLLASLTLPPVLVFSQHALGDRVQGNWPAIVYPAAAVAAGGLAAPVWRRLTLPSCLLGLGIAIVVYAHVVTAWPNLPGSRDPIARQLLGWEGMARQAEATLHETGAEFIAVEPYGVAAEMAWSMLSDTPTGSQLDFSVVGPDAHWRLTALPAARMTGPGLLIRPERYGAPDPALWHDPIRLPDFSRTESGSELERYEVFLVRSSAPDMVLLPRR